MRHVGDFLKVFRPHLAVAVCGPRVVDGEGVEDALAAITDRERVPGDGCLRPEPASSRRDLRNASSSLPGLGLQRREIRGDTALSAKVPWRAVRLVIIYWCRRPSGFLPLPFG
jgi:hypothetical protein